MDEGEFDNGEDGDGQDGLGEDNDENQDLEGIEGNEAVDDQIDFEAMDLRICGDLCK